MAAASLQLLLCFIATRYSHGAEFGPMGCYFDNVNGARDLTGQAGMSTIGPYKVYAPANCVINSSMTLQLCSSICAFGRFDYFGAQYYSECYCGNSYGSQGVASGGSCNTACYGNGNQYCGGGNRNSVYRQIYLCQIGNEFNAASRLYVNVTSSSGPFHRSLPASGLRECVYHCGAKPSYSTRVSATCSGSPLCRTSWPALLANSLFAADTGRSTSTS